LPPPKAGCLFEHGAAKALAAERRHERRRDRTDDDPQPARNGGCLATLRTPELRTGARCPMAAPLSPPVERVEPSV
jgi:hypothetical protein